ncbi:DUF4040 domain-containing protein [bacterium]|nr:DUF4040 domain-containing protein [bacterium]
MLVLPLLLTFLGAIAILVSRRNTGGFCQAVALAFNLAALAVLGYLSLQWKQGAEPTFFVSWMPAVGLDFSLWLDGPALFWSWLVLGIGALVLLYSRFYMDPNDSPYRFYASLMIFMGAMLGVVISRNLPLMFIFWEMTSLSSFLLIGHWHKKPEAIKGAKRAFVLTGLGGLSLMAGIAVLGVIAKDAPVPFALEWDQVWSNTEFITQHRLAPLALILMLLGALTKSAQFPFHFWLPGAMEAPTPVSAYLHAATMVKAGIYLMGRLYPTFNGSLLWLLVLGGVGVITMLLGGILAVVSHDIKKLLAWSTVSQLGLLTAYYGFGYGKVGGEELLTLDLLLIASHALFKGGLFMLCGVVDHAAHTRDWRKLGGLFKKMPVTGTLTLLGALSMAGMPFTLGFVAKKLFLDAGMKVSAPHALIEDVLLWIAIIASVFTVAYCMRLFINPFLGRPRDANIHSHVHEGGIGVLLSPLVLVGLCFLGGIYVPLIEKPISLLVNRAAFEDSTKYTVGFFAKADFLFWVSLAMFFIGGPLVYLLAGRMERLLSRGPSPGLILRGFDGLFNVAIPNLAAKSTKLVQSPSLSRNAALTLLVGLGFVAIPLFGGFLTGGAISWGAWTGSHAAAVVLSVLMIAGAAGVLVVREPLFRILSLSIVGLLMTGFFLIYRAPDLAITQILVELILLFMFLLLLRRIRGLKGAMPHQRGRKAFVVTTSIVSGAVMAALTFAASHSPERAKPVLPDSPTHAEFYLENSKYPAEAGAHSGGGNNVVNVILVDFRAMDTLGEVIVLAVAAFGVLALFGTRGRRKDELDASATYPDLNEPADRLRGGGPQALAVMARSLAVLALLFSGVLFLAGHNAPGGGFIAGLLAAIAVIPLMMSLPSNDLDRYWVFRDATKLIPIGMLIAFATGVAPWIFGKAFLRSAHTYIGVPLLGKFEVASAMAFDLGVFLVVVGVTLTILNTFRRA